MNKKKWLVLALTAVTLTSTACSSTKGGTGNGGTSTASTETAASSKNEAKPQLKSLQIWQKDDYNTYPVAKLLEEKTGYKVQYDMLPQDKPQDKLNLLIASSEPYDAVTTTGGASSKRSMLIMQKKEL